MAKSIRITLVALFFFRMCMGGRFTDGIGFDTLLKQLTEVVRWIIWFAIMKKSLRIEIRMNKRLAYHFNDRILQFVRKCWPNRNNPYKSAVLR